MDVLKRIIEILHPTLILIALVLIYIHYCNKRKGKIDKKGLGYCPGCGGRCFVAKWEMLPHEINHIKNNDGYWYQVLCKNCEACSDAGISSEEAINNWNNLIQSIDDIK